VTRRFPAVEALITETNALCDRIKAIVGGTTIAYADPIAEKFFQPQALPRKPRRAKP
jgi:hypothetical protein